MNTMAYHEVSPTLAKIELFLRCKQSADTDVPLNHSWSLTRKQIQAHTPTLTHDAHTHISRWRLTACFGQMASNEEHMSLSLCDGFHMLPQPHTPPGREERRRRACVHECVCGEDKQENQDKTVRRKEEDEGWKREERKAGGSWQLIQSESLRYAGTDLYVICTFSDRLMSVINV